MLNFFIAAALWFGQQVETQFEVWLTPKAGGPAKRFSVAPTREVADKVAAGLKYAGTAEVKPVAAVKTGTGSGTTAGNTGAGTGGNTGTGTGTGGGSTGAGSTGSSGQNSDLLVDPGQLTFDAEGTEGGPFHSRVPHVPSNASGLTIGRGYDMKEKSEAKIKADLIAAGLSEADAALYAGAHGLSGDAARQYIKNHKLPEITLAQQKKLFQIAYAEKQAEVKRICEKADVVAKYGATDWAKLDPAIKTLVTDLIYRGDYTGSDSATNTRSFLQPLIVANDVAGLAKVMADETKWPGVPSERFKARKEYMAAAAAALAPKKP